MNYINNFGYHLSKNNKIDKDTLKTHLTVVPKVNPNYSKETDSYSFFSENETHYIMPRYFGVKKYGNLEYKEPVKDINIQFNGSLRPYQENIVNECISKIKLNGGGIISIPCGGGKTVISIYIACKLNIKTLVVCHKSFLLNQWIERIEQFTNASVGIIRQNKIDIDKDIVVGMLQSIAMKDYDSDIFNNFGLVIFDECHHTPAKIFSKCLMKTNFKYTIGLSATPNRLDGMTKVMNWYLGDLIYKMEKKEDSNVYVKLFNFTCNDPLFKEKNSWFQGKMRPNIPKMITNITNINDRNKIINDIIQELSTLQGRKILILSHRIEHLNTLKKLCDDSINNKINNKEIIDNEITTAKYIGGMKEADLEISAQADIIFASYALAEEGLDIDGLNTLILATPKVNIIQSIGRIMRKPIKEGDVYPVIVDIVDNLSMFTSWGFKRDKYYNSKKYNVHNYYLNNDKIISIKEYLLSLNISENELQNDEDICYQYITNTLGQNDYITMSKNNTLDDFWKSTNYITNYSNIFHINYDWDIIDIKCNTKTKTTKTKTTKTKTTTTKTTKTKETTKETKKIKPKTNKTLNATINSNTNINNNNEYPDDDILSHKIKH